jgi:hypothetical protein
LVAALVFFVTALLYAATGVFCILNPRKIPLADNMPADSMCIDANRHAHYVRATITMGTPKLLYNVLVRFDQTVDCDSEPALVLTSPTALLSTTLQCVVNINTTSPQCTDAMLMYRKGNTHNRETVLATFRFGTAALKSTQALQLGMDGELSLCRGHRTSLTSHELCSAKKMGNHSCDSPGHATEGTRIAWLPARTDSLGHMTTNVGDLRRSEEPFRSAPAADVACTNGTIVLLMPIELSDPSSVVFAKQSTLMEREAASFRELMEIVESGTECSTRKANAPGSTTSSERYSRWVSYMCAEKLGVCESRDASYAYTRLSRHWVWLDIAEKVEESSCLGATEHEALQLVPRYDDNEKTVVLSWLRLVMMLVAAAIVYLRSSNVNARVDSILRACIWKAVNVHSHDRGRSHTKQIAHATADTQHIVLGLLACSFRLLIVRLRGDALSQDGQTRVLLTESIGSIYSVVHWLVNTINAILTRVGIKPTRFGRDAVVAMGGSSAVVDIACATMLAFADTPVRGGTSSFDVVARLLTAILITLVCVTRCMFSASCSGVLVGHDNRCVALFASVVGATYWLIQSMTIAVVLIDLFITPTGEGWWRKSTGDTTIYSIALFAGISTLSGPRISANARRIGDIRQDQLNLLLPPEDS